MRTRIPHALTSRLAFFALSALVVTAIAALPFRAARSSSAPARSLPEPKSQGAGAERKSAKPMAARLPSASGLLAFALPPAESIATYDATCATPKSDFLLGDTVCVKAAGVPDSLFPWRVSWVDTSGFIRQSDPASVDSSTSYLFTIPADSTTAVNGVDGAVVDNRGNWRVNLTRANGAIRQIALFVVHDQSNPRADVFVRKFRRDTADIFSGNNVAFVVTVSNAGPDASQLVHLIDSAPAGATLLSFTQDSGPTCTPQGAGDCVIASLPNEATAEFTAIYSLGGSSPGEYSTSATATGATQDSDADNNTSTAQFNVQTGSSSTTCELTCPSGITVTADTTVNGQLGAYVNFPNAAGTSGCGTITSAPASGSFFPVGTTVVTQSSGDGSCQFLVTVEEPPNTSISCPADKQANAGSDCQATVDAGTPTATGDNVTVSGARSDGLALDQPYPVGTTTITWIATSHDAGGNDTGTASCQQRIVVSDVTPPTVSAADQSAEAGANCQAAVPDFTVGASVSDNCSGSGLVAVTQDVAPGTLVGLGAHTITLTAKDEAGNTGTATATFTVNDTTAPTFSFVPQNVTANTGPGSTSCDATLDPGTATATDSCGPVTVTRSPAGNTFPVGTTTITWTAKDGSGNTATATQTVTVTDNTPPTITAPAAVTANTGPGAASCDVTLDPGTPTTGDNCGPVSVTRSPAGNTFPVGTTTITWTATDGAGNSSTATQTVTVTDNTPPAISCPANVTVYLPLHTSATSMAVNYPAASASDNCGVASIGYSAPSGSVFNVGTTPVTATATDVHGNTASCTFTVTVLYDFTGFFAPVNNLPTLNVMQSGRAVPVKFSLSGNKGLNIFPVNSPQVGLISCDASAPATDLIDTITAGGSSLSYDATSDQYSYVWKTDSSWPGTCRQLVVTLSDGSVHVANFKFK